MSVDKKRFLDLLKNYRSLTPKETKELIDLQRRFPYAQSIRAMVTWGVYHNDLPNKKKQLQTAALFAADLDTLKAVVMAPRLDGDVDDHSPRKTAERVVDTPSPSVSTEPSDAEASVSKPSSIRQQESETEIDKASKVEIDKVLEDLPGGLFNLKKSRVEFEEQLRELELSSKAKSQRQERDSESITLETPSPIEPLPYPVEASEYAYEAFPQADSPPPKTVAKKKTPKKTRKTVRKTAKKKAVKRRKTTKKTSVKKRKAVKKTAIKKSRTLVKAKKNTSKKKKVAKKRVLKKKTVKKKAVKKKASTKKAVKRANRKPTKRPKRAPAYYLNLRQQEQFKIIDKFINAKPAIKGDHKPTTLMTEKEVDFAASSGVLQQSELSETLVNLLLQQGKKEKAIELLKKLIWKHPKKKAYFEAQINALNGFR